MPDKHYVTFFLIWHALAVQFPQHVPLALHVTSKEKQYLFPASVHLYASLFVLLCMCVLQLAALLKTVGRLERAEPQPDALRKFVTNLVRLNYCITTTEEGMV